MEAEEMLSITLSIRLTLVRRISVGSALALTCETDSIGMLDTLATE